MGVRKDWLDFTFEAIDSTGLRLEALEMCELGNQEINVDGIDYKTAKQYFESLGIRHISIDLNGLDGALIFDLSKPIHSEALLGRFDVVTNFGTSEHVENQYHCFQNIHNFTKKGGLCVHAIPKIGHWKDHCEYYYDPSFFKKLAELCNYSIVKEATFSSVGPDTELACAALIKRENSEFIDKETFDTLPIKQKKYSYWWRNRTSEHVRILLFARGLIRRALKQEPRARW
jgi:2-polyprenyl-3-methyl-5-hydroxy-6-metoxy-1,4-benzoquinol methylase